MSIKQVGIGASGVTGARTLVVLCVGEGQQLAIDLVGFLAVVQAGPQIDAPARRPSCGLVTLLDECLFGCFLQVGLCQVVSGIKTDKVTLVAVLGVFVLPVVVSLIQVAILADDVGTQPSQCCLVSGYVIATYRACCANVQQQFADDG